MPHSFEEWTSKWKFKTVAHGRASGPCPLCGGEDRFNIQERDGVVMFLCRQCLPNGSDKERVKLLTRQIFGATALTAPHPSRKSSPKSKASKKSDDWKLCWNRSQPLVGTPAHLYLTNRGVVPPPELIDTFSNYKLPENIAWLTLARVPFKMRRWIESPVAGFVICRFSDVLKRPSSISIEALTKDGLPATPRYRRSYGAKKGAWFYTYSSGNGTLHLTEGELDAVALQMELSLRGEDNAAVVCAGGTGGLVECEKASAYGCVVIHSDGDPAGIVAADRLQTQLRKSGIGDVSIEYARAGKDPADYLSMMVAEYGWSMVLAYFASAASFGRLAITGRKR